MFGTRLAQEASCSFPLGGGRWGWGETRGRPAPLRRTPTPPSPVQGEGPAPNNKICAEQYWGQTCVGGAIPPGNGAASDGHLSPTRSRATEVDDVFEERSGGACR